MKYWGIVQWQISASSEVEVMIPGTICQQLMLDRLIILQRDSSMTVKGAIVTRYNCKVGNTPLSAYILIHLSKSCEFAPQEKVEIISEVKTNKPLGLC